MSMTAKYMGPGVHERILTRQDLVEGEIVEDADLPEEFKQLRWAAEPGRRSVKVDGLPDQLIEFLRDDPSFELKEDGNVVAPADPEAAHVKADGSSPGVDGNPELREAMGWDEPEVQGTTDSGPADSDGVDEQSFASAQDSAGTGMTVGGSTPGDS